MNDKKPSDLDHNELVEEVFESIGGSGKFAWFCPSCGLEHTYFHEIPFNIPIICNDVECRERMIIRADVEIYYDAGPLVNRKSGISKPDVVLINGEWVPNG